MSRDATPATVPETESSPNKTVIEPGTSQSPTTAPNSGKTQPPQRSNRVSIATITDPGPTYSIAARSIDHVAFRPRIGGIIAGMVVVVLAVWVAAMLGAQPIGIVIVAAATCFLIGMITAIHSMLRWENAENAYEKERSAAENWHSRFLQLHSESTRTTSVLSHMSDGILMLSPQNEIVLINDAAQRLLALPADGMYLHRKFAELVRIPEIIDATERARIENIDQNVLVEVVDGSIVRPVTGRVSRIRDPQAPHLLLVLRDETEAQRVEAIRREFIANVSHELKTPLAAIKGYAETVELAIEDDPDAAKHFIAQIETQCERLEDLIADMMRLARAQSGKGTLLIQAIDLQPVIQKAMASFLPLASAKQIELSVLQSDEPVHVMADEEAALTITQNLISNALRHTDSGGRVSVSCRKESGGWIMAVQDDGVGIAEEFQERIFERFYRVDRQRRTQDGGTGIGLSIVKNLTRALGGTVRVISSPGEGAAFEVWLRAPQ